MEDGAGLQLAPQEVHSWCVGLDVAPDVHAHLQSILSSDERSRCARFRFEHDRRRFVVAHGVLREILAGYLNTQPGRIRYGYNAFGKPDLSPESGNQLKFNLSHSAGVALIAVAAQANIGVDLECIRAQPDDLEIARSFFSPAEVDSLRELPSHLRPHAFFGCWTRKEAYAKARGQGLAMSLTGGAPAGGWSLYALHPAPGYIGALAIEGSNWRLRQRHWPSREAAA